MANLPDYFVPQSLRQFITSYNEIATAHISPATSLVDPTTGNKGAITNPEGCLAPERIEPWANADREQERGIISTILHEVDWLGTSQLSFPARCHVDCVGEDLPRLDSESALLFFDNDTLHKPATRILRALLASERIRSALAQRQQQQQQQAGLGHGVQARFEYQPGVVSFTAHLNNVDVDPVAGKKRKRDANSIVAPPVLGLADVFCTFHPEQSPHSDNIVVASSAPDSHQSKPAGSRVLFLKEAKASHRLTDHIIDKAVEDSKTLEPRAIMKRGVGGTKNTEDCQYWFAAVCAQVYTSMIKKGLRHGVISSGRQYIFLSIDPYNISILRYSCCRHTPDIAASPLMRTVALSFHAMRHRSLPASSHLTSLREGGGLLWATPSASFTTANSPDSLGRAETESYGAPGDRDSSMSGQLSLSNDVDPLVHNSTAIPAGPALHANPAAGNGSSPHMGTFNRYNGSAQPAKRIKTTNGATLAASTTQASRCITEDDLLDCFSYCTKQCLQSLTIGPDGQRPPVDPACPNFAYHNDASLTNKTLCQNLQDQLITRDNGTPPEFCVSLAFLIVTTGHMQMVKIRVGRSGHVILAKAFVDGNDRVMRNEAVFYTRLRRLQGEYIPVCVGSVELPLDRCIWNDGYQFTSLLLLENAGCSVSTWHLLGQGLGQGGKADDAFVRALTGKVRKALGEIHETGILHGDVELRNVLIRHLARQGDDDNPEWQLEICIIDFELSKDRKMYKRWREEQLSRYPHTRDFDQEFRTRLMEEMDGCETAVNKWSRAIPKPRA